jgi:hypothetical protein
VPARPDWGLPSTPSRISHRRMNGCSRGTLVAVRAADMSRKLNGAFGWNADALKSKIRSSEGRCGRASRQIRS